MYRQSRRTSMNTWGLSFHKRVGGSRGGGLPTSIFPNHFLKLSLLWTFYFILSISKSQSLNTCKRVVVWSHLIELLRAWAWVQSTLRIGRVNMHGEKEIRTGKESSFSMIFFLQQESSWVLKLEGIHSGYVSQLVGAIISWRHRL